MNLIFLQMKLLKGKNILIITNYLKPKSDKIYLSDEYLILI